jgi:hypothetical protein
VQLILASGGCCMEENIFCAGTIDLAGIYDNCICS